MLPFDFLKVELLEGSKIVWAFADEDDLMEDGSSFGIAASRVRTVTW